MIGRPVNLNQNQLLAREQKRSPLTDSTVDPLL
jgi:hypothetical protein